MKKLLYIALALGLAGLWSCVEDNPYEGPASIANVAISPAAPTNADNVIVTATITGVPAVTSATVQYKIGSGSYIAAPMTAGANDVWTGTIPKQANATVVTYYVEATNSAAVAKSAEKNYTVGAAPINFADLKLNEVDGTNKCIELYNAGPVEIPLVDVALYKDGSVDPWWKGVAASGVIAAGGYAVIIEANPDDPARSGNGGISMKKDVKFELKDPSGVSRGTMTRTGTTDYAGKSFQRCPNGTGAWKIANPTKAAKNPDTGDDIAAGNTLQ